MVTIKDVLKYIKKESKCNYRCKGFNNYLKGNSKDIEEAMQGVPGFVERQMVEGDVQATLKPISSDRTGYRLLIDNDTGGQNTVAVFYIN